jgi:hypothetical protein
VGHALAAYHGYGFFTADRRFAEYHRNFATVSPYYSGVVGTFFGHVLYVPPHSVSNEEDERIKITLHGGGLNLQVRHLQYD